MRKETLKKFSSAGFFLPVVLTRQSMGLQVAELGSSGL